MDGSVGEAMPERRCESGTIPGRRRRGLPVQMAVQFENLYAQLPRGRKVGLQALPIIECACCGERVVLLAGVEKCSGRPPFGRIDPVTQTRKRTRDSSSVEPAQRDYDKRN